MKPLRIQGKCNYFLQPIFKGSPPFQSATLILQAFTKDSCKVPLEVSYRFFRIKNKSIIPITPPTTPHIYHFSIDDIGSTVKIEISPIDNRVFNGTLEVFYGPIELDPSLKYTMENILTSGCSKFRVKTNDNEDFTIYLTQDTVRFEKNNGETCQFRHCLDKPRVEVHREDNVKFIMGFTRECENYTQIRDFFKINEVDQKNDYFSLVFNANSRNSKDLIVGILKSFAVRSFLINSKTFDYLSTNELSLENLSFTLEIEKLKKDFNGLMDVNHALELEKGDLAKEMMNLEEELKKTIENYTNIINEMRNKGNFTVNDSILDVSMLNRMENIEILRKVKVLERENEVLRENTRNLKGQIEVLENFNKNAAFFEESRDFHNENQQMEVIIGLQKKYEESRQLNAVLLREIAEKDGNNNEIEALRENIRILKENNKNTEDLQKKNSEKDKIIAEIQRKNEEITKELEKLKQNYLQKPQEKQPTPSKEQPNQGIELKMLKNDLEMLKSENEVFQRENIELLEDRKKKMEKILDLERENRILRKNPDFSAKNEPKNSDFTREKELLRENQCLKNENNEKNNEIEELRFKYNAISSELRVVKANKSSKNNEFEDLLRENQRLKFEISMKNEHFHVKSPKKSMKIENCEKNEKNEDFIEKIENLENEKRALINKNESLTRELMKVQSRGDVDNGGLMRARIKELEDEVNLLLKERTNVYYNNNNGGNNKKGRGIFS